MARRVLSLVLFVAAGLCEIGGGYLVWLWLRDGAGWVLGALGGFVLFLYGIVPAFQPASFHRTYAAYGGVFIAMAVFWGWLVQGIPPDRYDLVGAVVALGGAAIIFYAPSRGERTWQRQ